MFAHQLDVSLPNRQVDREVEKENLLVQLSSFCKMLLATAAIRYKTASVYSNYCNCENIWRKTVLEPTMKMQSLN